MCTTTPPSSRIMRRLTPLFPAELLEEHGENSRDRTRPQAPDSRLRLGTRVRTRSIPRLLAATTAGAIEDAQQVHQQRPVVQETLATATQSRCESSLKTNGHRGIGSGGDSVDHPGRPVARSFRRPRSRFADVSSAIVLPPGKSDHGTMGQSHWTEAVTSPSIEHDVAKLT